MRMHDDQIDIAVETVRELVDSQFPQWRGMKVAEVASQGTVNAIFRIGDGLTARFPLRDEPPAAVRRWLESEARALRELLGRTGFATPEPVAIGEPGGGYPLPWAVQTWIPGRTATEEDADSTALAQDLAAFIKAVRAIPTGVRVFKGGGRGGALDAHDEWMETCLRESEGLIDVPSMRRLWAEMRVLPREGADVMSHTDLIPGNVLVRDGRLTGVLDVGNLGPADPALDLVAAWHLLEAQPRQTLRDALACNDLEWARGRAWAFIQAMGVAWYYIESNPPMSHMGLRTLERVTADPRG